MRFLVAALAAALILLAPAAAAAACPGADPCPYSADGVIGQRAEGVLRFPQATAVGPDGSVYVGDQLSHAIQVFGPDGRSGARSASPGTGPGGLTAVGAVAVAADGSVYVADGADRIDRFAADGSLLNSFGSSGSGAGQFHFGAGGGNDSRRGRRDRDRAGRLGLRRRHAQRPRSSASPPTAPSPVVIVAAGAAHAPAGPGGLRARG